MSDSASASAPAVESGHDDTAEPTGSEDAPAPGADAVRDAGAGDTAAAGDTGEPGQDAEPGDEDDPAAPAPLNVPRTPTGDAGVDTVLERLGDADHLATDGHVEVYEDVHRGLRDALTALDTRPGPPAPPAPARPLDNRS
ncbi:hypothetical protein ABZT08_28110 [Streptomyces sp. NPDC005526]|uniref:hypothetical protein n=1 Tax=Streptomyces sp. NPDC005526 TaxID=3156885 RepID=UPI0033A137D6